MGYGILLLLRVVRPTLRLKCEWCVALKKAFSNTNVGMNKYMTWKKGGWRLVEPQDVVEWNFSDNNKPTDCCLVKKWLLLPIIII